MEPNSQDKLAELIHRGLMSLPERRAPDDLIPRVLARIEQQRRRWWQRPWTGWPSAAKIFSVPAMVLCAAAFSFGWSQLAESKVADWMFAQAAALARPVAPAWELASTLGNALLLSLRSLELQWWLISAMVVFLMYLTCVALGTVCFQVATQKR